MLRPAAPARCARRSQRRPDCGRAAGRRSHHEDASRTGRSAGPQHPSNRGSSPNVLPADAIDTLIAKGANIDVKTRPEPFSISRSRHGNTTLVDALNRAGVKDQGTVQPAPKPKPPASVRGALERSLPLLQRADVAFIEKAGCVSCHNNSLTAMTASAVRAKGVRRGRAHRAHAAAEHRGLPRGKPRARAGERRHSWRHRHRELHPARNGSGEIPGRFITDAWARYVKNNQSPDGRWQCQTLRPPLESSDFQVTAASIRSVRTYGPKSQRAAYDEAVARAVRWLEQAQPTSTEDHAFKVLGLIWGGGSQAAIQKTARELLALQQSDGGWGQLSSLASDAYATGQALVALRESRALRSTARRTVGAFSFCSTLSSKTDRGTSARVHCRSNRISTATSRTAPTSSSPRRRPTGPRWR